MRRLSSFKEKRVLGQDGLSLYYEVTGTSKKKVLVFVHGLGGDVAAWDEERIFFDYLGYSTIALICAVTDFRNTLQMKTVMPWSILLRMFSTLFRHEQT